VPEGSADLFPVFFSVWILLGLFSAGFFFLNKNAAFKRKVWPPFVVLTGVLFVAFALALRIPGQALVVMVPAVVLITFFNLRTVAVLRRVWLERKRDRARSGPALSTLISSKGDIGMSASDR